jgi:hypothetical protein
MTMKSLEDLLTKYPELFPKEEGEPQEPFSLFGFECDVGWYDILDNAFAVICSRYRQAKRDVLFWQKNAANMEETVARRLSWDKNVTEEWVKNDTITTLYNCIKKEEEEEGKLPRFVQIKEKFGGLRMYFDGGVYEKILAITDFAERMSEVTCEVCGNVGKTYRTRWHKTLCKEHAIERYCEDVVKETDA